jgi:hypothetical protein
MPRNRPGPVEVRAPGSIRWQLKSAMRGQVPPLAPPSTPIRRYIMLRRGYRWKPPYWFICYFVYFVDEMGLLRVSNFFTVSTVLPHQLFTCRSDVMSLAFRIFPWQQLAVCWLAPKMAARVTKRWWLNGSFDVYCTHHSVLRFKLIPIYSLCLVTPIRSGCLLCVTRNTSMRLCAWCHLTTWRLGR